MKRSALVTVLARLFFIASLSILIIGCEGPEGKDGADGATGPQGIQGEKGDKGDPGQNGQDGQDGKDGKDGVDGKDGTAGCITCHDVSTTVKARMVQWDASVHATGGNFERNGTSCARCHTHEGFREYLATGTVAAAPSNPSPIGCRTCHNIHATYAVDDYELSAATAGTFDFSGDAYDFGKGNLCANCHQSRSTSPFPEVGGADVEITNRRYGPHHGPQAPLLNGSDGYKVPGSLPYENTPHKNIPNGCITCHMAEAYGAQAGGHTMKMGYDYHEELVPNTAGCANCHGSLDDFDVNGALTEIEGLLAQLRQKLIDAGILGEDDYAIVPQTLTANQAGALYNYKMIEEDRSMGAHNPKYAKALLQNSIESF